MTDGELAELLRAVIARPDDHDVLQVYADVLIERGDPRGELIAVQLQRRVDDTAELISRERELRDVLDADLVARLDLPKTAFAWRRGFLEAIDFTPYERRRSLVDALRLIGTLPAARMLRRIVIRFVEPGWGSVGPIVSTLAKVAPQLRSLRELVFTASAQDGVPQVPSQMGELAPVCRAIPKLEVLELVGGDYATLRDVQIPALKRLVLELPKSWPVRMLGETNLPNLEELEIHGGSWSLDDLRGLLVRALSVRSLALHTSDIAIMRGLAREVPASPLFQHVRVFELRGLALTNACIDALISHAPRLRQLKHFGIEPTKGYRRLHQAIGDILVVR